MHVIRAEHAPGLKAGPLRDAPRAVPHDRRAPHVRHHSCQPIKVQTARQRRMARPRQPYDRPSMHVQPLRNGPRRTPTTRKSTVRTDAPGRWSRANRRATRFDRSRHARLSTRKVKTYELCPRSERHPAHSGRRIWGKRLTTNPTCAYLRITFTPVGGPVEAERSPLDRSDGSSLLGDFCRRVAQHPLLSSSLVQGPIGGRPVRYARACRNRGPSNNDQAHAGPAHAGPCAFWRPRRRRDLLRRFVTMTACPGNA